MNRPLRLTECFVGVCGMFATYFVGGRCIINNPFAMFWQSVSSRRGPIYRARKYEYTHEMANGNAYSVK